MTFIIIIRFIPCRMLMAMSIGLCILQQSDPLFCEDTYELGEVVVRAEEDEISTGSTDATSFVTIINTDELPSQVTSIPEVLDQSVGVNVKQYGGLGSFSTVSIRGSSSEQVVIYLDGILLNKAVSGVVNLADIPLDNVDRIEIYRGTSPAKFAASGIGGVVNIITKKTKDIYATDVNYTFGSFDTHKANLFLARNYERFYYTLFYNRTQSDGDFEFKDDRGTQYNKSDDRWTHRRNNDFHSDNFLVKGGYGFTGGYKIDVNMDIFQKHQGIPGIGNYQSRDARLKTLRSLSHVSLKRENFLVPGLAMELLFSYSYQQQRFKDLQGEIGFGKQNNKDDTDNYSAKFMFSYLIGQTHVLTLLCEAARETFQSRDKMAMLAEPDSVTRIGYLYGFTDEIREKERPSTKTKEQKRYSYSFCLEDEIYLFGERLLINPSIKLNYYDNNFKGRVPFSQTPIAPESNNSESLLTRKVGMVLYLMNGFSIRGNLGKYHRIPNFYELFGDRGTIVGNTNLTPEDGINWDIGFTFNKNIFSKLFKSFHFEYSYFFSDIDNLILFIQNSQHTSIAQNISKVKIKGHEIYWRIRFQWPILISGNYTVQDARDRSDVVYWRKNRLPGRPKYELFNRIEIFTRWSRVFYEIEFQNENYLDRANVRKIDRRAIQNVGFSWSPKKQIVFTFEIKNFADERTIDVISYPLPGRSFFGTVDARF